MTVTADTQFSEGARILDNHARAAQAFLARVGSNPDVQSRDGIHVVHCALDIRFVKRSGTRSVDRVATQQPADGVEVWVNGTATPSPDDLDAVYHERHAIQAGAKALSSLGAHAGGRTASVGERGQATVQ